MEDAHRLMPVLHRDEAVPVTQQRIDPVLGFGPQAGKEAAAAGMEFDQEILSVKAPTERWHKELMWIPGFLLFGAVVVDRWLLA